MSAKGIESALEIFRAGCVELVSEPELAERLAAGRPLRIKYGCDPSAPDLHLGHTVPLDKLRLFQELGHTIIFLVGDFTAMIGDPSGRSRTRPALSREQVRENAETYTEQIRTVLDVDRAEVRYNSEWMDRLSPADFIRLMSCYPVARMLERDDFKKRFQGGVSISIHEFLYPLVQGYDSVALEADVEVGGTDQTFNMLVAREIQRAYDKTPQIVITFPLLVGTDGSEKMSKSVGNAIGLTEPPEEIYGKTMSIPDSLLVRWIQLLAHPESDLRRRLQDLEEGRGNPRDAKAALARELVARFHDRRAAERAEAHFDRVFRQHQPPDEVERVDLGPAPEGLEIIEVLARCGFAASRGAARRLIGQGGVRVDGQRVDDAAGRLEPGEYLLQVGKRRFARVRLGAGGDG